MGAEPGRDCEGDAVTVHEKFIDDMEEAGFDLDEDYHGRYGWTGPAVECETGELQDVIRATPVKLQWDQLGKGLIVYPRGSAKREWQ